MCQFTPLPQTTAPTTAPRPGCDASSSARKICCPILAYRSGHRGSPPSPADSSVWNAPILTCSFSSTTRSVICRDDDTGSLAPDDVVVVVVGVTGGVNSTRVTWSVCVVQTQCDSGDPVTDTLWIQLLGKSWDVASERCIAGARTLSLLVWGRRYENGLPLGLRLYKCHMSSRRSLTYP